MIFSRLKDFTPIYRDFFRRYRWQIAFLVLLGFLLGLFEGVSIGMLIPLFSFATGGGDFGGDLVSRAVKFLTVSLGVTPSVWFLVSLFIGLVLITAALSFLFGYIDHTISIDYERSVVSSLYRQTFAASWPFLLGQKIGHLEHTLVMGVPSQTKLVKKVFVIIQAVTGFLMYFFVAFSISFSITLITIAFGILILIMLRPVLAKVKAYMEERSAISKMIAHDINENMVGLKTIKAMGVENEAAQKGVDFFNRLKDIHKKQFLVSEGVSILWQPMTVIFVSSVFLASYAYHGSAFDLAAFAAVVYLIQRIFMHVSKLHGVLYSLNMSLPYANMTLDLQKKSSLNREAREGSFPFTFSRSLDFRGVSFAYDGQKQVLEKISFSVCKGEMVGIVGRSGEGKTTICDLALRLFAPSKGGIYLDGIDITDIPLNEWRGKVGYVSQDIFLKNDTIANNIKFFDDAISDAEMIRAAKAANIYDFIQGLPGGFEAKVGERGVLLSGGQRQRIVLARAIARRPQILILDEATSALDNESEALVQGSIAELKGGVTILVVAHRLSTVMRSDRLLVLENGRIAEEGKPDTLLANRKSRFHKMYNIIEV